jgi:CheY-like chemotaxis protein
MEDKKTILIGEDEKDIAEMYKTAFDLAGFNTVLASNGEDVLINAREIKPAIILLDINMPVKDGFEVLKDISEDFRLFELLKNTPIIMLTNYNNQQDIDYCMKMGAQDYIVKADSTPKLVLEKVKKYLNIE